MNEQVNYIHSTCLWTTLHYRATRQQKQLMVSSGGCQLPTEAVFKTVTTNQHNGITTPLPNPLASRQRPHLNRHHPPQRTNPSLLQPQKPGSRAPRERRSQPFRSHSPHGLSHELKFWKQPVTAAELQEIIEDIQARKRYKGSPTTYISRLQLASYNSVYTKPATEILREMLETLDWEAQEREARRQLEDLPGGARAWREGALPNGASERYAEWRWRGASCRPH